MKFVNEIKSIDTKHDAEVIANKIIDEFHEKGKYINFTLLTIIYSKQDGIWMFEYSKDQSNISKDNLEDCGCMYAAIDGKAGELIKLWVEE